MSERDGVHNRDRWEESDDWFAEPEPAEGQPSDLVEEQGVITSSSTFLAKPFSVDELVAAVRNGVGA